MHDPFWYETFFDQRYLTFYPALEDQPLAQKDAQFVAQVLELPKGASLLDLGCGNGRHSLALAQEGFQVTGLDLSEDLLGQARQRAASSGLPIDWLQRDMRDLEDLGPFDACISLFTAFGFFGDKEDQEVLYQISASLQPEGRFLLDLTNFLSYLRRFPPEVWHEYDHAIMREKNDYDPLSGILTTSRTCFWKEGGSLQLPDSHVRAYFPHEIQTMLRKAGLVCKKMFGALQHQPFHWSTSPNQVYLCEKIPPNSSTKITTSS